MSEIASKKAVILLSGGLDSATILAMARAENYDCYALSFRYGQRHEIELHCATNIAKANMVREHKIAEIDLRLFGGSALTADIAVPKSRNMDEMAQGIPITYVPARNTVFLSFALAYAEVIGAYDIFIGVNVLDYSGYPDCRPEFIDAYEQMANLATARGVAENGQKLRIHAPIIQMSKAEIITTGMGLGVDYGLTLSCYDPDNQAKACGLCDACILRAKGFADAGLSDPALSR
jgi:7-cyano-7-deazaguanine synthase